MANPARVPGKRGANKPDPTRFVPTFEHYLRPWEGPVTTGPLRAALPPAFGDIDRRTRVPDFPMYCNGPDAANPPQIPDGVGDCTIAQQAHSFAAMRVYAGFDEPAFSSAEIIGVYSACGGYVLGDESTDNGCDPVTVYRHMQTTGLKDTTGYVHKIAGFAQFGDPTNFALMAQALQTFGSVGLAIDCPESAEEDFSSGQPWTYVPGSPSLGGHMICLQRRRVGGIGILECPTWGSWADVTRRFMRNQVQGAYVGVSEDWITANGTSITGFDLQQLLADMGDVE
jgi:hypothetical protein